MKKLVFALLVAGVNSNIFAANMYFYKNETGQVVITNHDAGNDSDLYGKRFKVSNYKEADLKPIRINQNTRPKNGSRVIIGTNYVSYYNDAEKKEQKHEEVEFNPLK